MSNDLNRYIYCLNSNGFQICLFLLLEEKQHEVLTAIHDALKAREQTLGIEPNLDNNIVRWGTDLRWLVRCRANRWARDNAPSGQRTKAGRIAGNAAYEMEYKIHCEILRSILYRWAGDTIRQVVDTDLISSVVIGALQHTYQVNDLESSHAGR